MKTKSTIDGLLLACLALCLELTAVSASRGDMSWKFRKCLSQCTAENCVRVSEADYAARQPVHMNWLQWRCEDECDYSCMWVTVEAFQQDGSRVPQFHGKWPFVRLWGIQEPASVVFSVLNFLAHFVMASVFWQTVPMDAPMYWVWSVYALVAMNAWVWSTVFHARDLLLTETLDYLCAVSLVFYSLFALLARWLIHSSKVKVVACLATIVAAFVYHSHYLLFVKFDYGYNMKVNIAVGVLNGLGWAIWCARVSRRGQPYVWKAFVTVFFVSTLVLLEVLDFPPWLWTFDAHSLWHAGTVPLPILWYSFIIDDCRYLMKVEWERGKADLEHQKNRGVQEKKQK